MLLRRLERPRFYQAGLPVGRMSGGPSPGPPEIALMKNLLPLLLLGLLAVSAIVQADAIQSLEFNPQRCGSAAENDAVEAEVRQLLYSKRWNVYRAFFTVRGNEV